MENASKALLFAAGILIAIILISVAVYLVNMSNDATKNVASTMTEMQLSTFNSKFTTFQGTSISGSQIKQLVEVVNASNIENEGTDLIVEMTGTGVAGSSKDGFTFSGGTARKYKVEMTKTDGAVSTITITGTTSNP